MLCKKWIKFDVSNDIEANRTLFQKYCQTALKKICKQNDVSDKFISTWDSVSKEIFLLCFRRKHKDHSMFHVTEKQKYAVNKIKWKIESQNNTDWESEKQTQLYKYTTKPRRQSTHNKTIRIYYSGLHKHQHQKRHSSFFIYNNRTGCVKYVERANKKKLLPNLPMLEDV